MVDEDHPTLSESFWTVQPNWVKIAIVIWGVPACIIAGVSAYLHLLRWEYIELIALSVLPIGIVSTFYIVRAFARNDI